MKKGDIVLIPFPFTNLIGLKNRPALVLINQREDVTVAFISSQINPFSKYELKLNPSDLNGLKKESIIKLSKIATIQKGLILGRLGSIDQNTLSQVDSILMDAFQLK
jgi:mRNA interferase MazF